MADKSFTVTGYLTITGRKTYGGYSGRISKITISKPALSNNEICIAINVKVPNAFFERLTPVINIELPQEAVVNPDVQTVIDLSAIEVADKLHLEVTDVQDALKQLLEDKQANRSVGGGAGGYSGEQPAGGSEHGDHGGGATGQA